VTKFESLRKEMLSKFDSLRNEMISKFDAMDSRFEAVDFQI
jgi:hypothetical protein